MSYYALSGLINFITATCISIFLITQHRRNAAIRVFTLFSISVAEWSLFYFLWLSAKELSLADFFMRTCMIGVLFMPSLYFHFIRVFLHKDKNKTFLYFNYFLSITFVPFVYTSLYAKTGSTFRDINYWLLPGPLFHIALIQFIFVVCYSQILLAKELLKSRGVWKNQLLYIFIGTTVGYIAGITNFFYWYRIPIPPILNIFVSFYVVFVSYAIVKYRLMDVEVVLKRGFGSIVFFSITAVIGIPLIFIISSLIRGEFFRSILIVFLFCILIPVLLRFKLRSEITLEQLLFKDRHDYRKALNQIGKAIGSKVHLAELLNFIMNNLFNSMDLKTISLHLKQANEYPTSAKLGFSKDEPNFTLSINSALIQELSAHKKILVKEEIETNKSDYNIKIAREMKQIQSEVCIPIFSNSSLTAICNIGKRGVEYIYTNEDIQAFETFASQLAVALDNAKAYKQIEDLNATLEQKVKERSDQLIEAQKLASIGRLVAGIAHHINNKINPPIQGAAILKKAIKKIKDNSEPLNDVLPDMEVAADAIAAELRIVKTIVDDLLASSHQTPTQYQFVPIDINAALQSAVRMIRTECIDRIQLHENYHQPLPNIKGDRIRLDDVFINILKNSLDAIPKKGNIWIKTWQENGSVMISLRDDGIGIPEENLNKIFDFFFTTKEVGQGTGLGLSVSYATIKEHRGDIQVKSKPGTGTEFIIRLPSV